MPVAACLRMSSGHAALVAALCVSPLAQAAAPFGSHVTREAFQAQYDTTTRQTRVTGRASSGLCFSFLLPQEWRVTGQGVETRLKAALSNAEFNVSLRSARELQHMPQPDLAGRDAAFLQRGYEDMLGRPAQSVSLVASTSGATRWSATWIDANLPSASHAMTVEAFIVPLSQEWVLELSLANAEKPEVQDALVQRLLSGLKVQEEAGC